MLEQFNSHIEKHLPLLRHQKVLIAISGGLDSVVLTHLCQSLGLKMVLAHCNFNLRGDESDADEHFVSDLANELQLELFVKRFKTAEFASDNKVSIQMAARQLRYEWFSEVASQEKCDAILTAHHADDNFETFLINLTRGTGLDGLTGIPEQNGTIIRPLLPFSREELEVYANEQGVLWRNDSSNASPKYLRNKLRHDIIPILKQINPQLLQNFNKTISQVSESQDMLHHILENHKKEIVSIDQNVISLDINKLTECSHPKLVLYHLLKDFEFTAWDDIYLMLDAQSGKQVFSSSHRLVKNRNHLLLTEIRHDIEEVNPIYEHQNEVGTSVGLLCFNEAKSVLKTNQNTIFVDADTLKYPLMLRHWAEGDSFHPFGMAGTKKLSKYFKDEKLSLIDKEEVKLLCSEGKIVWIVGRRSDERFKVTDKTKRILKIEFMKNE